MKYRVVITPHAESDLRALYRYIRRHAPNAAAAWIKGARQAMRNLAHNPERAHYAPERSSYHEPIRELLYGSGNRGTYRILFVVLEKSVFILHVRHGAMLPLEPEE